jgi:hypothetical protein
VGNLQKWVPALALAAGMGVAASAQAASFTYSFVAVTANSVVDPAIGEAQLSVDVSDESLTSGQVKFTFNNSGPLASSITDVYFGDDGLLGSAFIFNGSGVAFSEGASPPNLPSGSFDATYAADSDSPSVAANGVNPGESLSIEFNLLGGQGFNDVIAALDGGDLKIGIHVQAFADGNSEGFENNGRTFVPLPASVWGGLGLMGVLGGLKLRSRRTA